MSDHYAELIREIAPREDAAQDGTELRDLGQAIAQLPLAFPPQAANELKRILDGLLQSNRNAADRYRLLEQVRKPVYALGGGAQAQILAESHPLPPAKAEQAATVLHLYRQLGDAWCLSAWESCAPAGKVPLLGRRRVGTALAEAVDCLASALLLSYQLYQTPPPGLWQRMHAAYAFAAEHGLDKRESTLADDRHKPSIRERYVGALLLAMSNPYAFQRAELVDVVAATRVLAPQAQLLHALGGTAAVASADADAGPGYLPQERGKPSHGALSLDLEPVIDLVRDQVAWTPPGVDVVDLRQRHGGSISIPRHLLDRLVKTWLGSVDRDFKRMHARHSLDTVLGLHAVHQALADGQGFDSFQRHLVGREIELGSHDTAAAAWLGSGGGETLTTAPARVLDQSLGGYRLLWPTQQRLRVRIGELVGLAATAEADEGAPPRRDWLVGIVRWLRSDHDDSLSVGVELLSRQASPAAVRGIDAHGVRGPMQRALWLGEGEGEPAALLLSSLAGRHVEAIEVSNNADARRGLPALRSAYRRVTAIEPLSAAYYRVSLSGSEPDAGNGETAPEA